MFVLRSNDTFDWPVKAWVPQDGKRRALQFMATFNQIPSATIGELVSDPETRDTGKFLEMALVSFSGFDVQDEAGNPIEDNETRNEMVRTNTLFIEPLLDAYAAGALGHKAKN